MKKLFNVVFVLAFISLVGCTSESDARSTLHKAGYSDIKVGGYAWFECGENDRFQTKFTAKNPAGHYTNGTVCCGWLTKGCTIRF